MGEEEEEIHSNQRYEEPQQQRLLPVSPAVTTQGKIRPNSTKSHNKSEKTHMKNT